MITENREHKIETATKLRLNGHTQKSIAEVIGVNQGTIQRWLNPDSYSRHLDRSRQYRRENLDKCRSSSSISEKKRADKNRHSQITYFISDQHGYVKIGSTVDTKRRLTDLQVAHAEPIILLAVVEQDEDSLHKKFSCDHVRGEWFMLSEDIKQYVKMHHPKLSSQND